ncbi:ABC transporter ATP-binding protein [Neobacillus niacini]|uniref:ABC transporter ATP-binding protein n=1 Tax=Neobacillus niacini TaxID=86668 RepID=UPI0021CB4112|nr:ABC transporter ATP-binding protein [Neobacillus niacini]MCM3763769.1 ABC transporter ATP-binding protein [Neobacillus niacini]
MDRLIVKLQKAGYSADESVIENVSFTVEAGELVGLIGENGAGKSTTIKAILGQLSWMEGEITLRSKDNAYGYVPERPVFYDELTVWEQIEYSGVMREIPNWKERAMELVKTFRVEKFIHQLPQSLSKGTQQKIMLILALLPSPELLIIDEPFIGLDPRATKLLLQMMDVERSKGTGILMCTHVLDTAEKLCDKFILLSKGTMFTQGTLVDLQTKCRLPGGSLLDCFDYLIDEDLHHGLG